MDDPQRFQVVIAGGGVAGLEASLALRELAGDRVAVTLLEPESDFVYRPQRVGEPFALRLACHYPLAQIADEIGFVLRQDRFSELEVGARMVRTEGGAELAYDALLLALGARPRRHFDHALTLDDRRLDEQLQGLIQDIEGGYTHAVAFLIPPSAAWPLPIYELALMTARRAAEMNVEVSIAIVTPEEVPLAVFGGAVSQTVEKLLEEQGILTVTSAHAAASADGEVSIYPGERRLRVDRIIALPELTGPSTPGVPKPSEDAFIPVDPHGRVPGLERVYAAGDGVEFPVKHGGIAAQQADVAAEAIAALAGVPIEPAEFHPVISGILIGGGRPLYMCAHLTGGHGAASEVSYEPLWTPVTKIAARYLSPYLAARERAAVG